MTDITVLVVVIVQAVVCWGALIWLAIQRGKDQLFVAGRLTDVAKDDAERHLDALKAIAGQADNLKAHTHPLEPHDHAIYALAEHRHDLAYAPTLHDHPHAHDHTAHTHTLVNRSEHEENGKKVVVKTCEECGTVFRDKQD